MVKRLDDGFNPLSPQHLMDQMTGAVDPALVNELEDRVEQAEQNVEDAQNAVQQSDMRRLVKQEDGSYLYAGIVRLDDAGAMIPSKMRNQPELFFELGHLMMYWNDKFQLWLGDWFVAAQDLFKANIEELAAQYERSESTLYEYYRVCKSVPKSRRLGLSFSHLQIVAGVEDERERFGYLEMAAQEGWSVAKLKLEVSPPGEWSPFQRLASFFGQDHKKILQLARQAGPGDRVAMVILLRDTADAIEAID